ncbi:major facilitator transporter [Caballeronia terrestris]|uniref:Major facilitator transporter n=1 Tax=Caballeronia terrestris TaxID=1226301 RepID=A0A158K6Z8_9BURK|nr:hypothetical protein [Caballeronia terrestris]SAL76330.1 major facilitator transporter [Caballeronia terrestris]
MSFWLPTLVKASGVADPLDIGLLSAIPYAAAAVSMLLVSQSSDARGERRWHLALPGVVRAAGLCASVAFADSTPISQFRVLPPAILSGAAAVAGRALANSIGSVSGVVSPYVIGLIQTGTGSTVNGCSGWR